MIEHNRIIQAVGVAIALTLTAFTAKAGDNASPESHGAVAAKVAGVYILPDTSLASVEDWIKNDRKILLGSVGGDLWHEPKDPPNRFWMVSDRGPNGKLVNDEGKKRTFPVPEYTPLILYVETRDGEMRILKKVPIVDSHGVPVTGLPNVKGHDEKPFGFDGRQRLPYNPNGLDTEGLVRTAQGDFWLAEEYGPSLVHCDGGGRVLKRYRPEGQKVEGTGYPIASALPGILARRKKNRGFEGLALSRDGKTLYAAMQSPLQNPDSRAGSLSRNIRILALRIAEEKPVAEYVYQLEPAASTMISALAMLPDATMLVLERTSSAAWLYRVDLAKATNVLGSKWDDASTSPSLEATAELSAAGVVPLLKTLAVDLSKLPDMPEKIEGVAVIDARTIAIANDNDFDIGDFDAAGNNRGTGVKNRIGIIRLASPLFAE
jgi:hypothetical protein